jgi:hypothetical protein
MEYLLDGTIGKGLKVFYKLAYTYEGYENYKLILEGECMESLDF